MASRDFNYHKFIKHTGLKLIQSYFEKNSIPILFSATVKTDEIIDKIEELDSNQIRKIEEDFLIVNNMADSSGVLDLKLEAIEKNLEVPEFMSEESLAMWFFINHNDLFEAAIVWDRIRHLKHWEDEHVKGIDENIDWKKRGQELADAIKDHYWLEEKRKIKCCSKVFRHEERISIVLYPEGHPKATLKYLDREEVEQSSQRPIQEIYFVVNLKEEKISVKSTAGHAKERVNRLKELFFKCVLNKEFSESETKPFKLRKFLHEEFGAKLKDELPSADGIEFVKVKEITLKEKNRPQQSIILRAKEQRSNPHEIYKMMNNRHIEFDSFFVYSVEIQVKFPGKGLAGSVSFRLRHPSSHTLGRAKNERKCKEYLKLWNLIDDE